MTRSQAALQSNSHTSSDTWGYRDDYGSHFNSYYTTPTTCRIRHSRPWACPGWTFCTIRTPSPWCCRRWPMTHVTTTLTLVALVLSVCGPHIEDTTTGRPASAGARCLVDKELAMSTVSHESATYRHTPNGTSLRRHHSRSWASRRRFCCNADTPTLLRPRSQAACPVDWLSCRSSDRKAPFSTRPSMACASWRGNLRRVRRRRCCQRPGRGRCLDLWNSMLSEMKSMI